MVKTASTMMPLGTLAPDFDLPHVVTGERISASTSIGPKGLLVMFICRHCPFVIHIREELARLGRDYGTSDIGIVAISSNDAENYPDDAPAKLAEMAEELGFTFPLCHDETQSVAKAYGAACTPDFFLFDGNRKLIYRGQLDDSRPGNSAPVNGRDLRDALDAALTGRDVLLNQTPSIGCNIKWKPGNEPGY
ncbi:MAG: thioredoxin family protein [Myxococcota bacterium]|nr:thioredoxin family protein [Myxococcota bacterium]